MGFSSGPKHRPKEVQRGIRDEVVVLDSSTKRGVSRVNIEKDRKAEKQNALKNPEVKEQLMDFIFGKSDENPLEDISKKYNNKSNSLDNKKYKVNNVTGVRDE